MSHHNEHAGHHHKHPPQRPGLHKDWRTWVVVGLMLVGMAVYVLSFDEEDAPGPEGDGLPVPAATE